MDKEYYRFFLVIMVSLVIAWLLSRLVRKGLNQLMKRRGAEDDADLTRLRFIKNSLSAIFFGLAIFYIFLEIPALNRLGQALFAGAGVLAAIIGFASQKAFSNIVSGIFILLFRPFRIGDTVELGGRQGVVEDITLRHTVIRNYEHRRIIIPNSVVSDDTIINSDVTDRSIRQQIFFDISYESDIPLARRLITEEAESHPFSGDQRTVQQVADGEPVVVVRLMSMNDSSVTLRAQVWSADVDNAFVMKCDLLESVKRRFGEAGIQIPYPHRQLVFPKEGVSVSGSDGK